MICLHGGNYTNERRVEVYCNEQWGTICDVMMALVLLMLKLFVNNWDIIITIDNIT